MPTIKTERRMKIIRKIAFIVLLLEVALVALFARWIPSVHSKVVTHVSPLEAFWAVLPPWPSGWDPQAQATLAGAIITGFAGLVAGALGWWFQYWRVRAERKIEVHYEVLRELQKIAVKHYAPAMSAAGYLATSLEDALKDKSLDSEQTAFYAYCRFHRLTRDFLMEYGAFMLNDFSAESSINELVKTIREEPRKYLTDSGLSAIGALVERDLTLFHFQRMIAPGGRLATHFDNFRQWLHEKEEVRKVSRYAGCYSEIMAYELNVIYKPFYGKEPPEPSGECLKLARELEPRYRA